MGVGQRARVVRIYSRGREGRRRLSDAARREPRERTEKREKERESRGKVAFSV